MRHSLTYGNLICRVTKFVAAFGETVNHFVFRNKSFDNAQATQRFFQLRHRIAPLALRLQRLAFQFSSYHTHQPTHSRQHNDRKESQLPAGDDQCRKIQNNHNRTLHQHIQRAGNGVFHFTHVPAHTSDNISFSLFREE